MKSSAHIGSINTLMRKLLKFQLWVYAILLSGALLGCATPPVHLTPVLDRPNMDKIYFEGRKFTFSFGEKSSVAVSGAIEGNELRLLVQCVSHTERIDVIPENISVSSYGIPNQRMVLKAYPPAEYMVRKRNTQSLNLAMQVFLGTLAAHQAGQSTATTYGSSRGKSFVAETKIHNQAAVESAQARYRDELRQTVENYDRINAVTESGLLKAHTIFNNQVVGGMVIVELLKPRKAKYVSYSNLYSKIVITVPWVEEEPHRITLTW